MSKLRQLQTKLFIAVVVIVVVSTITIIGGVKAYQNYAENSPKQICEAGATCNYIEAQQPVAKLEGGLGGGQPAQTYDESYTNFTNLNVNGLFNTAEGYDPFIVGNTDWPMTSTGTAKYVWTATEDTMCAGALGLGMSTTTSPFSTSIVYSLGTTTSATGYSVNLIASTTVATSSAFVQTPILATKDFIVREGESIVGALSDNVGNASTTYFGRNKIKISIPCWRLGK